MKADTVDNDLIVCWAEALHEVELCHDNNYNKMVAAGKTTKKISTN